MKSLLLTIALASAPLWADLMPCSAQNGILNGAYVVTLTGTAGSPVWNGNTGPVATLAKFVFDGMGSIQLLSSTIVGANPPLNVSPPFTITGSYTVNSGLHRKPDTQFLAESERALQFYSFTGWTADHHDFHRQRRCPDRNRHPDLLLRRFTGSSPPASSRPRTSRHEIRKSCGRP